jgi:peptidyl-dipeptidase A
MRRIQLVPLAILVPLVLTCGPKPAPVECPASVTEELPPTQTPPKASEGEPTVDGARAFMDRVEADLLRLWVERDRANWVKATYIIHDTEILAAASDEKVMAYVSRAAAEAVKFDKLGDKLPYDVRRKIQLLKRSLSLPAPGDAKKRAELARIATFMDSTYGKGKYCPPRLKGKCLKLGQMTEILAKSRKYDELLDVWKGWRTISPPMRARFERYVALANEGARELGFDNLGDLWKSGYDMPPAAFEAEVQRLWSQVKPLYNDLHCYVRAKLQRRYGKKRVPGGKPIPAHLLGNMWSQEWTNIFDLVAPQPGRGGVKLERILKAKKTDERGMVRYGEAFFVSLGLSKLPKTFWERSMFKRPRDRDVVCHASAWDVDFVDDVRIKMCIKINGEDFATVHHELGHNYYQYYYRNLPALYRESANDGFHEALGDTISLSVTPPYMVKIGLLRRVPKTGLNPLMRRALEKVAFLPFGFIIDKWRWDVFAGRVKPADYNKSWWELRTRYQGIEPPVARSEKDFDPGAKYHIPANVPYTRYFLAAILQFQFHRALCKLVGHKGPLHTCSIYDSRAAGERLRKMMEMGQSRPWPEALKVLTGEDKMDATAILSYFAPLHEWLKEQNKGKKCGW